jgi:phosphohistidine phosphatase
VKTLLVLRHAKSSWDDASLADGDRPLAPRGRKALPLLARHLEDNVPPPELVLCSSARRAVETLEGVRPALGDVEVRIEPGLYLADSDELIDVLRTLPAEPGTVMLVGHNPGLQELVLELAAAGDDLERVRSKLPTGALATLELDIERWADLEPRAGRLASLAVPRELA